MANGKSKYIREVGSYLICSRGEKKRLIQDISARIDDIAETDGAADYDGLVKKLGSPEEIASDLIKDMDTVAVCRRLRAGRFVMKTVIITVTVLLLLFTAFVISAKKSNERSAQRVYPDYTRTVILSYSVEKPFLGGAEFE